MCGPARHTQMVDEYVYNIAHKVIVSTCTDVPTYVGTKVGGGKWSVCVHTMIVGRTNAFVSHC